MQSRPATWRLLVVMVLGALGIAGAMGPRPALVHASPAPDLIYYGRSDGTIWSVQPDGSADTQITTGNWPRLSPNGRYLAFHRGSDSRIGKQDIWVRDLKTGTETDVFTPTSDFAIFYSWSGDSSTLYYDYDCNIYKTAPDGTNTQTVSGSDCLDDAPNVNPIDGRIVGHNDNIGLWVEDANGQHRKHIPNTNAGEYFPTWSPDGQWIVFMTSPTSGDYVKIHPDGTDRTALTSGEHLNPAPQWGPGDTTVIGSGTVNSTESIVAVASDGSGTITPLRSRVGDGSDFVGSELIPPLSAPLNPTAQPDDGGLTITWSTPDNNGGFPIDAYSVTCTGASDTNTHSVEVQGGATLMATVWGLTNGLQYSCAVAAHNALGAGPTSSVAGAPAAGANNGTSPPGAPTVGITDSSLVLAWTAPTSGSTPLTYTALCARPDGSDPHSTSVAGTVLTATVTGLTNDVSYTCRVIVLTTSGGTAASQTVNGTPDAAPQITGGSAAPTVTYGSPLLDTITASDSDSETVTLKSVSGVPDGLLATPLLVPGSPAIALQIHGAGSQNRVTAGAGTYPIQLTLSDGVGMDVVRTVTVTVQKQPAVVSPFPQDPRANPVAPQSASASGLSGTIHFSLKASGLLWYGPAAGLGAAAQPTVTLILVTSVGTSAVPVPVCQNSPHPAIPPAQSSVTATCTVSQVPEGVYDARLSLGGSYFAASYDTALTVAGSRWNRFGNGRVTFKGPKTYPGDFGFMDVRCDGVHTTHPGGFLFIAHPVSGEVIVTAPTLNACPVGKNAKALPLSASVSDSMLPGQTLSGILAPQGPPSPHLRFTVSNGKTSVLAFTGPVIPGGEITIKP